MKLSTIFSKPKRTSTASSDSSAATSPKTKPQKMIPIDDRVPIIPLTPYRSTSASRRSSRSVEDSVPVLPLVIGNASFTREERERGRSRYAKSITSSSYESEGRISISSEQATAGRGYP